MAISLSDSSFSWGGKKKTDEKEEEEKEESKEVNQSKLAESKQTPNTAINIEDPDTDPETDESKSNSSNEA